MTIIIANSADLDHAHRLVNLAWKEYEDAIGQPAQCLPEMKRTLVWLAWQACKIERESQEEVRRLAIEEERAACAKITDDLIFREEFCYWQAVADAIGEKIRARGGK